MLRPQTISSDERLRFDGRRVVDTEFLTSAVLVRALRDERPA